MKKRRWIVIWILLLVFICSFTIYYYRTYKITYSVEGQVNPWSNAPETYAISNNYQSRVDDWLFYHNSEMYYWSGSEDTLYRIQKDRLLKKHRFGVEYSNVQVIGSFDRYVYFYCFANVVTNNALVVYDLDTQKLKTLREMPYGTYFDAIVWNDEGGFYMPVYTDREQKELTYVYVHEETVDEYSLEPNIVVNDRVYTWGEGMTLSIYSHESDDAVSRIEDTICAERILPGHDGIIILNYSNSSGEGNNLLYYINNKNCVLPLFNAYNYTCASIAVNDSQIYASRIIYDEWVYGILPKADDANPLIGTYIINIDDQSEVKISDTPYRQMFNMCNALYGITYKGRVDIMDYCGEIQYSFECPVFCQ